MNEFEFNKEKKRSSDNLLSSDALSNSIKNLSNPRFLGSIHMNKQFVSNFSSVENLLNGELEMRINRSLKNTLINPITKVLILITILFNLLWLLWLFL
ncbi:MAG: hypothetical protein EU532_08800 [Promethearchaeota archaeon]|nr:MAG: hypothetical protein EU532_08800 [Candidatus Lokiarchaeota archaeon]